MKKIIITGATGTIGSRLAKKLMDKGYPVTVFTRNSGKGKQTTPFADVVEWDYNNIQGLSEQLTGAYGIIHLAGANVFGRRWDEGYKNLIRESRIVSTRNLIKAISALEIKPKVLITASAIGYYGDTGEMPITEDNLPGNDFLAGVVNDWESEALKGEELGVRTAVMRTGIVLNKEEGALKEMLTPFKLFVGGPLGNGKQWFSWVHIDDAINAYLFALENDTVKGAINITSPNPVRMKEFAKTLGKVLNRPSLFPVPGFVLKIVTGEVAEVITQSQKVLPEKLINLGYNFSFTDVQEALKNLLKKG